MAAHAAKLITLGRWGLSLAELNSVPKDVSKLEDRVSKVGKNLESPL